MGAQSEIEMKEKKDRVDDAVLCTKSALEEGVIPGGGIIYVKALETLNAIDKPIIKIKTNIAMPRTVHTVRGIACKR